MPGPSVVSSLFRVAQMAAYVAGQIDPDAPLREAPLPVVAIRFSMAR